MKKEDFEKAFEDLMSPIVEKVVERALSEKNNQSTPVDNPEQFLTIGQAAKEFGCTKHLLQSAINNLELDYYKPENRTYIKRKDVYNYLESIRIRSKENKEDYDFLK